MAQEQNQNLTLEDYVNDLQLVSRVVDVSDLTKEYNKQKNKAVDLAPLYHKLGMLVTGDRETFIQATDSGIVGPISDWQEANKENINETIGKYKDRIFEDYVKIQNVSIEHAKEDIKEDIKKELS